LWIWSKMSALVYIIIRWSLDDGLIWYRASYHRFVLDRVDKHFIVLYMTFRRCFVLRISPTCLSVLMENSVFFLPCKLLPHYWGIFHFWRLVFIEDIENRFEIIGYLSEISFGIVDNLLLALLEWKFLLAIFPKIVGKSHTRFYLLCSIFLYKCNDFTDHLLLILIRIVEVGGFIREVASNCVTFW